MANLNIGTILGVIRTDVLDTLQKTNEVSQVMSLIRSCEGLTVTTAKQYLSGLGHEKATVMLENVPFTFDFEDAVDPESDSFNVLLSTVASGAVRSYPLMEVDADTGLVSVIPNGPTISGSSYNFDNLVNQTAESLMNADLISGALDAVKTVSPTAYFDSVLAKYNGRLSGTTPMLVSQLKAALSQADASGSLALVLRNVYSNIQQAHAETDGSLSFPNDQYYVQGFCGELVLDTIFTAASGVLTALLAAINPVIGAVSFIVGQIGNGIKQMISSLSDTQFSYRADAIDDLYAQPVCYKTLSESDVPYTVRQYLSKYGVLKIVLSTMVISVTQLGNQYTLIVVPRVSYGLSFSTFYPDMSAAQYNNTIYSSSTMINHSYSPLNWAAVDVPARTNDMSVKMILVACIIATTNLLGSTIAYAGSDCIPSYSTTMSTENLAKFFGAAAVGSRTSQTLTLDYQNLMSWTNIVNYIIPSMQYQFNSSSINWSIVTYALEHGNSSVTSTYTIIADTLDERSIRFVPPTYSITAMLSVVAGLAITAATTAAVIATSFVIRRKIRNIMHKRQVDIEAAKYRYEATGSQQDWDDYFRQIKSYNKIATVTGLNKISLYNGQELSLDEGTPFSANLGIKEVLTTITGRN